MQRYPRAVIRVLCEIQAFQPLLGGLSTESQDFLKEVFEPLPMIFAEVADRVEVWLLIGGKIPKHYVAFKQAIEFAGTSDADRVTKTSTFSSNTGWEDGRPRPSSRGSE